MKQRIRAGRLRTPVQVQNRTQATDAEGNVISTWTNAGTVFAQLEAQGMAEVLEADRLEQDITWLVTLRYPAPVTHQSRLLLGSRTLDVRTVVNVDESNREVMVRCLERVIAG